MPGAIHEPNNGSIIREEGSQMENLKIIQIGYFKMIQKGGKTNIQKVNSCIRQKVGKRQKKLRSMHCINFMSGHSAEAIFTIKER